MSIRSEYVLIPNSTTANPRFVLLRRFFVGLITTLILLYVGLFVAYQAMVHSPLGERWWLRFYNIFGYLLYAPLPPLLLLPLFKGQRKLRLLALAIPLLFFAYEYGAAFLPKLPLPSVSAAVAETPLRVMTWNTYFVNNKIENLVAAIESENPDILAVQEFGSRYADEFSDALAEDYPYRLRYPSYNPDGYGIFSRYPLKLVYPPIRGYDACNCIEAEVTIGAQTFRLISVHPTVPYLDVDYYATIPKPLSFDTYHQDLQHKRIQQRIAIVKEPLLLVGDFNASDRMAVIGEYQALMTDSFREAGWGFGFTFPYGETFHRVSIPPMVRLDYIFHTREWHTSGAWNGHAEGADHRYVVADLILKQE